MDTKKTTDCTPNHPEITLYEVTARDGFQMNPISLMWNQNINYPISVTAGYRDIEVSSFVKPSWIPDLDGEELLRMLTNINIPPQQQPPRFWALIPITEVWKEL